MNEDIYEVVQWPDIQSLMELEGFRENSHLINDEIGLNKYGSSAYFVKSSWLKDQSIINLTKEEMSELHYAIYSHFISDNSDYGDLNYRKKMEKMGYTILNKLGELGIITDD